MTRTLRVVSGVVLAVVMVVAVGSCSSSHDDAERAVVPTTPETTVPEATSVEVSDTTSPDPTPLSDEEAIIAAVHGYWRVILEANRPPDPSYPELTNYMAGTALEVAKSEIATNRERGYELRLPDNSRFELVNPMVTVDSDRAIIDACLIDDGLVINSQTGEVLNGATVISRVKYILERHASRWLLVSNQYIERDISEGECRS